MSRLVEDFDSEVSVGCVISGEDGDVELLVTEIHPIDTNFKALLLKDEHEGCRVNIGALDEYYKHYEGWRIIHGGDVGFDF